MTSRGRRSCAPWRRRTSPSGRSRATPASSRPTISSRRSASTPTAAASATTASRARRSRPSHSSSSPTAPTRRSRSTRRCAPTCTGRAGAASSTPCPSTSARRPAGSRRTCSTPCESSSGSRRMPSRLADLIRKARRLAAERDRLIDSLAEEWARALRGGRRPRRRPPAPPPRAPGGGRGRAGRAPPADPDTLAARVVERARRAGVFSLRPVINATGVVLHTNLGRALVSSLALERLAAVGAAYSNLELDLATKERGSRYSHVEGLLTRLTGAEDALVVNNNAAAVLLALETLAHGREVVVSRGELIEIGGEFRIPDIMRRSGAVLREVGTTNRTHLQDYAEAIGPNTALLLKVHTSNYRVVGFTADVSSRELVELGRARGIPVMEDLGSGSLVDLRAHAFPYEPTVPETGAAGVDLGSFSGDKLLGWPQAGLVVGKHAIVAPLQKNPCNRALRLDKL